MKIRVSQRCITRRPNWGVVVIVHSAPVRPARWLLGEGRGVQVWVVQGDHRVRASVLIGVDGPIVLLNERIADTPAEQGALAWALQHVAAGQPGFYVLRASR